MRVWVVIYRAGDDDRVDGGVEDDFFVVAYKNINKAQLECRGHLRAIFEGEPEIHGTDWTDEIEWAETTRKGDKLRKFLGRPKADVEGWFDVLQVEVV
jgi:hypothetical protein